MKRITIKELEQIPSDNYYVATTEQNEVTILALFKDTLYDLGDYGKEAKVESLKFVESYNNTDFCFKVLDEEIQGFEFYPPAVKGYYRAIDLYKSKVKRELSRK